MLDKKIIVPLSLAGVGFVLYKLYKNKKNNLISNTAIDKKENAISELKALKVVNIDDKINEAIDKAIKEDDKFWDNFFNDNVYSSEKNPMEQIVEKNTDVVSQPMSFYWALSDCWSDQEGGHYLFTDWFGKDIFSADNENVLKSNVTAARNFAINLIYYRDTMHNKKFLCDQSSERFADDNPLTRFNLNGAINVNENNLIEFVDTMMLSFDDEDILHIRVMLEAYIIYCYLCTQFPDYKLSSTWSKKMSEIEWFKFFEQYGQTYLIKMASDSATNIKVMAELIKQYKGGA